MELLPLPCDDTYGLQGPWLLAGYQLFATQGPDAIKVEVLARKVGKNKSSFYHHFADKEVYMEFLLNLHQERTQLLLAKEAECTQVIPNFLELLVAYKADLLFSRQLRVHRHVPAFKACFEKTNQQAVAAIQGIWAQVLGLEEKSKLVELLLLLSIENFYLQITAQTLNYEWLEGYVRQLQALARAYVS